MKVALRMDEVLEAFMALTSISQGADVTVSEGGKDRVVKQPYKNISIKTAMALAKNLAALKTDAMAFQNAMDMRRMELTDTKGQLSIANQRKLQAETGEALKETHEYELVEINPGELFVDEQKVSPLTLAPLLKLLNTD